MKLKKQAQYEMVYISFGNYKEIRLSILRRELSTEVTVTIIDPNYNFCEN